MTPSSALPHERTPFFERQRSLVRIRELLVEHRLVTLTGVGGTGKTRLALRMAHLEADSGRSVAWVSLVPVTTSDLLATAVCDALDVRSGADESAVDALVRHLQDGPALVVLDNCEHLIDACAMLVSDLLQRCATLAVLTTSRERLGVPEEVLWPVSPLAVPPTTLRGMYELAGVESVQFFIARARALEPDFDLTADNAPAVGRLCALLDGIPLALELSAARIPVLTPQQILEHLDQGIAILRRQGRSGPDRHRTMEAALEWSHGLLDDGERRLFRRLAIFAGGGSLEAIRATCTDPEAAPGSTEILDPLTRLIDRSLVVVNGRGTSTRYRLLEPVRRFALARLESSGERPALEDLHAAVFLEWAEARAGDLRGPRRSGTLDWFVREHDNLRAAWDHSVAAETWPRVARLARAMFWFWNFAGYSAEGRVRADRALEQLGSGPGLPDLLWVSGTLAWMQGESGVALPRLERCTTLCREQARDDLLPLALRELGGVHLSTAQPGVAAEFYQESAERLADTARAGADRASHPTWDRALTLAMLADVRTALGDADASESIRRESRALFQRVGDPWGLSLTHFGLAVGAARQGDLTAARTDARRALELQRVAGDDWNAGQIRALLGEVEWRADNPGRARNLLAEALRDFRGVGDRISLGYTLRALSAVEAERGRSLRAIRAAGAARALSESVDGEYPYGIVPERVFDEAFRALQSSVGEAAFAAEWSAGAAQPLEQLLDEILDPEANERPPRPSKETIRLHILGLGMPRVFRDDRSLQTGDWGYAVPRHLLFYLLLNGPRTREQIGLDFWPDASPDQLRGRLRTALYHLRRALGGTEWIRYRNGRYAVDRDAGIWFDVEAFRSEVERARARLDREPRRATALLESAVELYRGELLEGESTAQWADAHRDELRRNHLEAIMTVAERRSDEGAHRVAAEWFRRAIRVDDLNERAHRGLAEALGGAGDRAGALRTLEAYEALLARELDARPSEGILELRTRLEG